MDLDTAQRIIRSHGWTPRIAPRRNGLLYVYAGKRAKEKPHKMTWRYIGPVNKIEAMSEEQIIEKIRQTKRKPA